MALVRSCVVCKKEFKTKTCFILRGHGKFCSRVCHHKSMRTGKMVLCGTCGKEIYRKPRLLRVAKNKKFFCGKSCQALWRNQIYAGPRHKSWKGGSSSSAYTTVLRRTGRAKVCEVCGTRDERIIAVHHKDRNRSNNIPENLAWLCHNCHFLVHHYDVGRDRGLLRPRS